MGLLYKNHHPDKTVRDSGRTVLPYVPPHPCLARGLQCLQWLLRFSQQLAGGSHGPSKGSCRAGQRPGVGPHSLDCAWGPRDGRAPQDTVLLSYMKSRAAGKSATHGLRLLCKNECPAPPSGPRGGPSTGAVGRGTLCVGRPHCLSHPPRPSQAPPRLAICCLIPTKGQASRNIFNTCEDSNEETTTACQPRVRARLTWAPWEENLLRQKTPVRAATLAA